MLLGYFVQLKIGESKFEHNVTKQTLIQGKSSRQQ